MGSLGWFSLRVSPLLNSPSQLSSLKMSTAAKTTIAIMPKAVAAQKKVSKLELDKSLRSVADESVVRVNRIQGVNHDADTRLFLQNKDGEWMAEILSGKIDRYVACSSG